MPLRAARPLVQSVDCASVSRANARAGTRSSREFLASRDARAASAAKDPLGAGAGTSAYLRSSIRSRAYVR